VSLFSFVMDGDAFLYGTNKGSSVPIATADGSELVYAPAMSWTEPIPYSIAMASARITEATFFSDCSFVVNEYGVTVRRWSSGANLDLYTVSVAPNAVVESVAACTTTVTRDIAGFGKAELSATLSKLTGTVDSIASTAQLGLLSTSSAAFSLNSEEQVKMWGLAKTFCQEQASAVFIAFADQTVMYFSCDDEQDGKLHFGLKQSASDVNAPFEYYLLDGDTGLTVGDRLANVSFDPTGRPW